MADYDLDVDYEPEKADPDIKLVNEEEKDSDAEYAKMDLPLVGTLCHRMMNHKCCRRI